MSVQRVMALVMVVRPPRFHTDRLGTEYTVVGDWQAFLYLCCGRVARQNSFYEISSNIHDVPLAQMFVQRIVGLRAGEIVYDGSPDNLSYQQLTEIYGEEDWGQKREVALQDSEASVIENERAV